ncbi:MAG: FG-GAP-like repeat-containing protein [Candidatus Marinimicrobia bacterium]|nr:FG-GAP-like repeat-containing protein [Candidatus Neomarinimicrobiota bacterium]
MGMNLPKWSITLLLLAFSVFAMAGGNGVNSYTLGWSETHATDPDVYWGVSGPYDFDGDGYQEVLGYTDAGGITAHLYENTGDDTWEEAWTHTIVDVVYSYEACDQETDLDRDGIPELLIAGEGGGSGDYSSLFIFELDTAAVALGNISFLPVAVVNPAEVAGIDINGDGTYATSTKTIVANDLDADGVTELLIYDGRTHAAQVMSLDTLSDFSFPNWVSEFVDSESFCCSVYGGAVIGDFDADGTNNFAMVEWDFNGIAFYDVVDVDEYELILFTDDATTYDGGSLRSLESADLDNDGYTEIYLASTAGVVLLYSIGDDISDFDISTDIYEIYVGDGTGFNGAQMGNTDIWHGAADGVDYIISQDSTSLLDLEYDGEGDVTDPASWTAYEVPAEGYVDDIWNDVCLGDFDYDGLDEILAISVVTPTMQIFEHDGWNTVADVDTRPVVADTLLAPGWQTRGVQVGSDLDGDGFQEVIITDYQVHGVHVYEVTANNTLEWVATMSDDSTTYGATPRHVITGDLDGNGLGEIIYLGMRTPGEANNGINVWEWDGVVGSDTYTRYVMPVLVDGVELDRYYGDRTLNVGDPDGDGQQEILISNNGSNNLYDIFMIAHVEGTFASGFYSLVTEYVIDQTSDAYGGSPGYGQANVTDLDGDGDKEVCFFAWDHTTMLVVETTDTDEYELQSSTQLDSALTDKVVYGTTFVTDIDDNGADEIYGGMYSAGWVWQVTGGDDVADISYANGNVTIISDFGGVWDVTGGDGDGDGVDEIYSVDYTHGRIYEWDYSGGTWDMSVVTNWNSAMGGFSLDFADDLDGDGYPELVQGFLEPPFSGGNEFGYTFSVSELGAAVGIDQNWTVITPADYKLSQNYPNPFNPSTTIDFTLPLAKDNVNVIVYNMLGQEVVRLANDASYGPGSHSITWNSLTASGTPAAAGIYVYELRVGNVSKTAKMTLIK